MKFISLQENLKKGLNTVGHVTSKNVNLPILNNILIKASQSDIELISTNLEIGINYKIRGKIEEDGDFTVDSKLITEYVNLLNSGEKVLINQKDNELSIECGNYKTKIKGESAKDFPLIPTIPEENSFNFSINEFKKALNSIVFAVSTSENRLELTGVLFSFFNSKLNLAATDSYRLAEKTLYIKRSDKENKEKEEIKVIVPSKTVQEVLRILNNFDNSEDEKEIKIYLSENQILFTFDSVSLISRLINGHYPDYKQIIPTTSKTKTLIKKSELIRAVKAAALFSKTGVNDIFLQFSKGKIIISAFSGASGESLIKIEADVSGENNEITINHRYLLDGLNNIDSDSVQIIVLNDNSPCLLKAEDDENYLYIVMPIKA
jgi:DNA polymerase-3 subunit beta